jgi:acetoin utilization protein AcuB
VVLVRDRIGVLADVCTILKDAKISIVSMITLPLHKYPGIHELVMRVPSDSRESAVQRLSDAGYRVITEYIQDLEPYLPPE